MKILKVNLLSEAVPGLASKCFAVVKGDEIMFEAGLVYVRTCGRCFAFPVAMCALEIEDLPTKGSKK